MVGRRGVSFVHDVGVGLHRGHVGIGGGVHPHVEFPFVAIGVVDYVTDHPATRGAVEHFARLRAASRTETGGEEVVRAKLFTDEQLLEVAARQRGVDEVERTNVAAQRTRHVHVDGEPKFTLIGRDRIGENALDAVVRPRRDDAGAVAARADGQVVVQNASADDDGAVGRFQVGPRTRPAAAAVLSGEFVAGVVGVEFIGGEGVHGWCHGTQIAGQHFLVAGAEVEVVVHGDDAGVDALGFETECVEAIVQVGPDLFDSIRLRG